MNYKTLSPPFLSVPVKLPYAFQDLHFSVLRKISTYYTFIARISVVLREHSIDDSGGRSRRKIIIWKTYDMYFSFLSVD